MKRRWMTGLMAAAILVTLCAGTVSAAGRETVVACGDSYEKETVTAECGEVRYTQVREGLWDPPKLRRRNASVEVRSACRCGCHECEDSSHETVLGIFPVKKGGKKLSVQIRNARKGDQIVLKVGKKTIRKKLNADCSKKKYTFRIKKQKAGTQIRAWVADRKGRRLTGTAKDIVYKAVWIRTGMTKKQVSNTAGWRYPDQIRSYPKVKRLHWYYDDDGDGRIDTKLFFTPKGTLSGWSFAEPEKA